MRHHFRDMKRWFNCCWKMGPDLRMRSSCKFYNYFYLWNIKRDERNLLPILPRASIIQGHISHQVSVASNANPTEPVFRIPDLYQLLVDLDTDMARNSEHCTELYLMRCVSTP